MSDVREILEKSEVIITDEQGQLSFDVHMKYSPTNKIGTGGKNDLISRQEAVVLVQQMNQKIFKKIQKLEETNKICVKGENSTIPLELDHISRTLDYVIWAIRELPCANQGDLPFTNLRPLE